MTIILNRKRPPVRRKGGGGGGRGGGISGGKGGSTSGKGSTGKGSSSSSSGRSGGKSSVSPFSIGGKKKSASTYDKGGGAPVTIPPGSLFAGRQVGGGRRDQIFGTRTYGSGYPGLLGRGVAGRGFPFYFWPLVWGVSAGIAVAYLYDHEYGLPGNSSRPGGSMAVAIFPSSSTNTTLRLVADNSTVSDLITAVKANCSSSLNSAGTSSSPSPYVDTPRPEQVVQYYRASSLALTLDGYNNTATFQAEGTPDASLPDNVDAKLLECANQTIGLAAPLISGADFLYAVPNFSFLGLLYVIWNLLALI